MNKEIIQLNISEYLAYILLYAANADFETDKEELDIIRETVSKEEFRRIKKAFDETSDNERLRVIMHYRDAYISLLNDTSLVTNQFKSIFTADEKYSAVEKAVYIFLKKLLNLWNVNVQVYFWCLGLREGYFWSFSNSYLSLISASLFLSVI